MLRCFFICSIFSFIEQHAIPMPGRSNNMAARSNKKPGNDGRVQNFNAGSHYWVLISFSNDRVSSNAPCRHDSNDRVSMPIPDEAVLPNGRRYAHKRHS